MKLNDLSLKNRKRKIRCKDKVIWDIKIVVNNAAVRLLNAERSYISSAFSPEEPGPSMTTQSLVPRRTEKSKKKTSSKKNYDKNLFCVIRTCNLSQPRPEMS